MTKSHAMAFFRQVSLMMMIMLATSYNVHAISQSPTGSEKIFRLVTQNKPETLDPQNSTRTIDQQINQHIFDPLFTLKSGEPIPILIESYQWLTPTEWEFTLKKGIKFHNGSELTSKDVIATFKRAFRLKNRAYRHIKHYKIAALDDYRFKITTTKPNSELLWDLEDIQVIHHSAENTETENFDSGEFLIGTGPYQLLKRRDFDELDLVAFPQYHRGEAFIKRLNIQHENDHRKRAEIFLTGNADMIEDVPDNLLALFLNKANISSQTGNALYFIALDTFNDISPDITDSSGKPLDTNPLKDIRVRQAISKALDRSQLIRDIYGEYSSANTAGQLVNSTAKSTNPSLLPDKQDVVAARQLLKEAGYPEGFQLILRDKQNRRHWLEAIAPMLNVIGLSTTIETLDGPTFFSNVRNRAYSTPSFGYSTDGNLANILKQLLFTGAGYNAGGYSNPVLDQQLNHAMQQTSETLKRRELRKAQNIAIKDLALIPILFMPHNWVTRKDMVFLPTDQYYSEAYYVHPQINVE